MRLIAKEITRTGDNIKVVATWKDRMKRDGTVKVETKTHHESTPIAPTVIEGEAGDVFKTLSGLAEIAWGMGWRPDGLDGTVASAVKNYKIPEGE